MRGGMHLEKRIGAFCCLHVFSTLLNTPAGKYLFSAQCQIDPPIIRVYPWVWISPKRFPELQLSLFGENFNKEASSRTPRDAVKQLCCVRGPSAPWLPSHKNIWSLQALKSTQHVCLNCSPLWEHAPCPLVYTLKLCSTRWGRSVFCWTQSSTLQRLPLQFESSPETLELDGLFNTLMGTCPTCQKVRARTIPPHMCHNIQIQIVNFSLSLLLWHPSLLLQQSLKKKLNIFRKLRIWISFGRDNVSCFVTSWLKQAAGLVGQKALQRADVSVLLLWSLVYIHHPRLPPNVYFIYRRHHLKCTKDNSPVFPPLSSSSPLPCSFPASPAHLISQHPRPSIYTCTFSFVLPQIINVLVSLLGSLVSPLFLISCFWPRFCCYPPFFCSLRLLCARHHCNYILFPV